MIELLSKIDITELNSLIHEFEPVTLNWWDTTHQTSIEVEIDKDENDVQKLRVVFCPDVEDHSERVPVFITSFKNKKLKEPTKINKLVCETLMPQHNFTYCTDHDVYLVDSFQDTRVLFAKISDLIVNKHPIHQLNLLADHVEKEHVHKHGETFHHFIAMMYIENLEFTEESIINHLKHEIEAEGHDYIELLRSDLEKECCPNLEEKELNLDKETIKLIKQTILNYMHQMA